VWGRVEEEQRGEIKGKDRAWNKRSISPSASLRALNNRPRHALETHAVETDQPAHARLVDLASDLSESRSGRVGRTVRTGRSDLSVDSGQKGGEGGEGGKGRHEHLEKSCFSCFFVCRFDVKGVV
jgi:hypothetical protein